MSPSPAGTAACWPGPASPPPEAVRPGRHASDRWSDHKPIVPPDTSCRLPWFPRPAPRPGPPGPGPGHAVSRFPESPAPGGRLAGRRRPRAAGAIRRPWPVARPRRSGRLPGRPAPCAPDRGLVAWSRPDCRRTVAKRRFLRVMLRRSPDFRTRRRGVCGCCRLRSPAIRSRRVCGFGSKMPNVACRSTASLAGVGRASGHCRQFVVRIVPSHQHQPAARRAASVFGWLASSWLEIGLTCRSSARFPAMANRRGSRRRCSSPWFARPGKVARFPTSPVAARRAVSITAAQACAATQRCSAACRAGICPKPFSGGWTEPPSLLGSVAGFMFGARCRPF